GPGYLDGDAVGVEAVRMALAVAADGRDDRDDVALEHALDQLDVHALDPAGPLVIDAVQDAGRGGGQGVAVSAAPVVERQALQQFVRDPRGGGQGELQRGRVGDASAVEVGRALVGHLGQALDLVGGAVDENDVDVQRAQQGDVQEEIAEVSFLDDGPVQGD